MSRSDLEALFLQLCLDHDLPRPQVNRYDNGRELDFRWPERRLAVETNGFWVHRSRDAFESDHERRLKLEAAGWRVVSLTWRQVVDRPNAIAAHVRRVLEEASGT
jgi:very-short-patch-repair endonuclease